jgi:hypothetical protein
LTIVVEVYNGTRIKQAMNLLSRTLNSGAMKVTGNGQQNQIRERAFSENILPMQESGQLNFIKGQGDYLEIRTRIRNFLLMVILISR